MVQEQVHTNPHVPDFTAGMLDDSAAVRMLHKQFMAHIELSNNHIYIYTKTSAVMIPKLSKEALGPLVICPPRLSIAVFALSLETVKA